MGRHLAGGWAWSSSRSMHRPGWSYGTAIDDNTKLAADIDALQKAASVVKKQLHESKNQLSMAEHHRNKAEFDCEQAVFSRDKALAELARDKAFYEARIVALSAAPVPTSQPDSEAPIKPADAERAVLLTRIENLKKELSGRDAELAKLRSEISLSNDVNTLRAELAEAKAVSARLSGMYEQKSKDFRESELERLTLLGKQIIADGEVPKETPLARPRPVSRRGCQRSRSTGRSTKRTDLNTAPEVTNDVTNTTPASSQPFWQDEPLFTKQVAAVTTATMTALPHLPFETAIANAFTTVRNVGPPPHLNWTRNQGTDDLAPHPRRARQLLLQPHRATLPSQTLPGTLRLLLPKSRRNRRGELWKLVKPWSCGLLRRVRGCLNYTSKFQKRLNQPISLNSKGVPYWTASLSSSATIRNPPRVWPCTKIRLSLSSGPCVAISSLNVRSPWMISLKKASKTRSPISSRPHRQRL